MFGEDDVTLQMESELDDFVFYQSFSGYFPQLESEWRNMLQSIAVLCQKKLRKIGQREDLRLVVLALVHTDEEQVYFRISFRVIGECSAEEADLFSQKSLMDLTGQLDWSKLDLNIVNFD